MIFCIYFLKMIISHIHFFLYFFLQCNKNKWGKGREEKALDVVKEAFLQFIAKEVNEPITVRVAQNEGFQDHG